jgi:xanthine/CO dehydrogenase XdhC/CoxF family maturation factor
LEIMSNEVYEEIAKSLRTGEPLVLATVASTRGSTPRKAGAKMIVRPDGSFFGTIGGGCGEAEVWQKAMEVIETGQPEIVRVDLTTPIDGEDKICGGIMDVFVERITRGQPSAISRQPSANANVVSGDVPGEGAGLGSNDAAGSGAGERG